MIYVVELKIKNNTEEDFDNVGFQFYGYDTNGDRVGAHFLSISDMEVGHST